MNLHLSFVTLMNHSIMSTCSCFPYTYTIIGRSYAFNFAILNSLSPRTMVTLYPSLSYLSSTMSSTFVIWAVDLDLRRWEVTEFNFSDLVARKGYPLTKNKLMYNCTSLWCSDIGNGSGMRSILSDFGWYIVILPCNRRFPGQ